ncbi:Gfo/Idh/MocA family protein [Paenibacillus sp. GCM10023248]|uniref:Gfo/Idh/MocA family protein n=1 Tax=Bacillales TaxID=1385 RepID=UPI0023781542|nr:MULTISPECIES: Gfo/Idh/MocA family oxidoreductase [Bacillales]MDD9266412.1 Gfo/Idh/MocA family oxidoreductase [Paenibacillus sp. MAHUQ-63]MDR6878537.1 virulence factor [Bacillus sp. 3255]
MAKRRIGIIGLGDIAQKVYLPLLSVNEQVEIAGIMSFTPATVERMAAKYRIPFGTTQLDELLALGLDAVFVHSPTPTHYEIAMKCMERGIAVYVDKPLSYDWAQSVEMASYAERRGVLLAAGFNRRFAPLYMEARDWLRKAGGFDWCSAVKHRIKQQGHSAKETLYDDLIHMLDVLLWLGETPYEVAVRHQQVDPEGRLLHASGTLAFDSSMGTYSMVRLAGVDLEKVELHGSGRSVEVTNLETAVFYEQGAAPRVQTFGSWDTVLERRGFAGVVQHFLDSIDNPNACTIRGDLVLPSHQLVERLSE